MTSYRYIKQNFQTKKQGKVYTLLKCKDKLHISHKIRFYRKELANAKLLTNDKQQLISENKQS